MSTLGRRILDNLDADPDRPSVAFVDGRGGFSWISRKVFLERAAGLALRLEDLGLGAGDAGVLVSVDPEFSATALTAMILLGAVPLLVAPPAIQGVNSNLTEIIRHTLAKTRARVALLPAGMSAQEGDLKADGFGTRLVFGTERLDLTATAEVKPVLPDPLSVACFQLTSGTTGFPRICVWQHPRMLAAVDGMVTGMRLSSGDVFLNWTPLYHDMGLVNNFLLCQVHGLPLALQNPLDVIRKPSLWLRGLADTRATHTWSPNFGFAVAAQRVRDSEIEGLRLDPVAGFWNAAERIHMSTMREFHRRFAPYGVRWDALKTNFGCTENIGGATFSDPGGPLVAERVDAGALQARGEAVVVPESDPNTRCEWIVSAGRPHPGVKVHILDPDGNALPDGCVGEVALETASRLTGFLGEPEATAAVLRGASVLTGDLGYKRGEDLFWVGRSRERINLHGLKYDPSEFEAPLFGVQGLRKGCFAVFGVDDTVQGTQTLVLLAEVDEPASRPLKAIADDARREVAVRMGVTVGELVLVPKGHLTKTSSGKRRHTHFKDLFLQGRIETLYRTGAGRIG